MRMLYQFESEDTVCSVYELDIVAPDGTMFTAEMADAITVAGDKIVSQARLLRPAPLRRGVRLVGRRSGGDGRVAAPPTHLGCGGVQLTDDEDVFWEVASGFLSRDGVEDGTMFGFPCIRLRGFFVAMPGNTFGGMVVQLPAGRVAELIESGLGVPIDPAGRPFREWVAVDDQALWPDLIDESLSFAESTGGCDLGISPIHP